MRDRYARNGGRFDEAIIRDLVDMELKEREDRGHEAEEAYLRGKLARDACLDALRGLGQGLWWAAEALWYLVSVDRYSVGKPQGATLVVQSWCTMEYVSSHLTYGNGPLPRKAAQVTVELDEGLKVTRFDFRWC